MTVTKVNVQQGERWLLELTIGMAATVQLRNRAEGRGEGKGEFLAIIPCFII